MGQRYMSFDAEICFVNKRDASVVIRGDRATVDMPEGDSWEERQKVRDYIHFHVKRSGEDPVRHIRFNRKPSPTAERFYLLQTLNGYMVYVANIPHKHPWEGVRLQTGDGKRLAEIYCPLGRDQFFLMGMIKGLVEGAYGKVAGHDAAVLVRDFLTEGN